MSEAVDKRSKSMEEAIAQMEGQKGDSKQKGSIDFMLAEYEHHLAEFRRSEELGESRMNLFLAIVAAVFTGGAFAFMKAISGKDETGIDPHVIYLIIFCALCVTLLFGYVTLVRLVHRNLVSTQELRASGRIRRYFWDKYPEIRNYLYYKPYDNRPVRKLGWKLSKPFSTFKRGGLVETIILLNAIIAATLIAIAALIIAKLLVAKADTGQEWLEWPHIVGILSSIVFGFCFAIIWQVNFVKNEYYAGRPKEDEIKFRKP
jgi:hypothetical protein